MVKEKRQKSGSSCETKYTIVWDIEEQDLEPLTCRFCGFEVEEVQEEEIDEHEEHDSEDDNWN